MSSAPAKTGAPGPSRSSQPPTRRTQSTSIAATARPIRIGVTQRPLTSRVRSNGASEWSGLCSLRATVTSPTSIRLQTIAMPG